MRILAAIGLVLALGCASLPFTDAPLPSWNDGPSRAAIVAFVEGATRAGGAGFIAPEERIAVFDNDGTLWAEQPLYFQFEFALDRVKELAPQHPEWKTQEPYAAALARDLRALAATGEKGLIQILVSTHTGMTTAEFHAIAADWIAKAKHPATGRPYPEMAYAPMRELLDYLRANGFKTYIVSGGGIEFMRTFSEHAYGIPPEQVIGSFGHIEYGLDAAGVPQLVRTPKVDFVDDGPGKPVGIQRAIGRRPVFAFGNSDGDQQMLQWTAAGEGPRFVGIVHHTDAEREWAYDHPSHIGQLDAALAEARAKGWTVVDMEKEWKRVFVFE